ncbi:hypothetical protein C8R45DRAFT_931978 [Mycena sanguinolenta]|nr:hypothetical protein C8R45DRAFT_931978 [Mycena sanguinolenta]
MATPQNPTADTHTPLKLTARQEFLGIITAVDSLVGTVLQLSHMVDNVRRYVKGYPEIQAANPTSSPAELPVILDRFSEEEATDRKCLPLTHLTDAQCIFSDVWVRVNALTPNKVEEIHVDEEDGIRDWWIVYIGREPNIYKTKEEADAQVKGCPIQQYRLRNSKQEALTYYRRKWNEGLVAKWVECV